MRNAIKMLGLVSALALSACGDKIENNSAPAASAKPCGTINLAGERLRVVRA